MLGFSKSLSILIVTSKVATRGFRCHYTRKDILNIEMCHRGPILKLETKVIKNNVNLMSILQVNMMKLYTQPDEMKQPRFSIVWPVCIITIMYWTSLSEIISINMTCKSIGKHSWKGRWAGQFLLSLQLHKWWTIITNICIITYIGVLPFRWVSARKHSSIANALELRLSFTNPSIYSPLWTIRITLFHWPILVQQH